MVYPLLMLHREDDGRRLYAEAFLVFSSRRVNPTGRGKIGWTLGAKVSNAFVGRNDIIEPKIDRGWRCYFLERKFKVLGAIQDLAVPGVRPQKRPEVCGSAWVDNGYKTMAFGDTFDDYTDNFSLDSPGGEVSMIDFDFGILYAVNDNFRIGLHFQQPYIDFYWEFFEF